jgi:hypothetical protein
MRPKKPRRRRFDSPIETSLTLFELSDQGRRWILLCFEDQAKRQGKTLVWRDVEDWDRIRAIRERYFHQRICEVEAFRDDKLDFEATAAKHLRGACAELTAALSYSGHGPSPNLWRDLWGVLAFLNPELSRDRIAEFAHKLQEAAEQLYPGGDSRSPLVTIGEGRCDLIAELAAMFRDKDLSPTTGNPHRAVAKGRADPSPFVEAASLLMRSVPKTLQESLGSLGAFTKAVARELRSPTRSCAGSDAVARLFPNDDLDTRRSFLLRSPKTLGPAPLRDRREKQ